MEYCIAPIAACMLKTYGISIVSFAAMNLRIGNNLCWS